MAARSAGILLHRRRRDALEVLLVHPGGPYWAGKDQGAWSIPKGEYAADEDPLAAARREFAEELGSEPPSAPGEALGEVTLKSGKRIQAWALAGELEASAAHSNTCMIEWPPRSGRRLEIPEIDRAEWFSLAEARSRLTPAQRPFLDRLEELSA